MYLWCVKIIRIAKIIKILQSVKICRKSNLAKCQSTDAFTPTRIKKFTRSHETAQLTYAIDCAIIKMQPPSRWLTRSLTNVENEMTEVPAQVRQMLARAVGDMNKMHNERIADEAAADPAKHKDCIVFKNSKRYCYYQGEAQKKGNKVYFCYTVKTNVAGYYVTWTELHTKHQIRRVNFHGWEKRKDAREYCLMRKKDSMKPRDQRKFAIHA